MNTHHLASRAAQERAAAKRAADPRARRCHEQLAELHSRPSTVDFDDDAEDQPSAGHRLIILS